MRKPEPKGKSKQQSEHEKGGQKSTSPWTEETVGKALDVAKAGFSTAGDLADWGKEVQRTKQTLINAGAKIAEAKEETTRVSMTANVQLASIQREHLKDKDDHELEMERLRQRARNDAELIRQRDRVLDKLLDNPGEGTKLLAASLRMLLPNGDQQ